MFNQITFSEYFRYFFEDGMQLLGLGSIIIVWFGMTVIGRGFGCIFQQSGGLREIDHLIGWSLFSLLFTAVGVFTPFSFPVIAAGSGVIGIAALLFVLRTGQGIGSPALYRALLLALPLLLLASAMKGSQWDEFTDWLIIPRYMLESGAFPGPENPYPNSTFSGYPYSWHYISYLSSLIFGQLLESAGAVSNIFLLIAASTLLVRLVGHAINDENLYRQPGWALVAFTVLVMTLINATFAQKVVLTAYADTSSAIVTGTALIVAWFCIEALVDDDLRKARSHAISLGLLLLLLVNLKQATLVLALLIAGGFFIIALREKSIRFLSALKLAGYIIIPPLVIFLVWRYQLYSDTATIRELSVRPFSGWFIALIPEILARMTLVLSKKGYYLILMLLLIGTGLRGFWQSKTPFDRFAALSMGVVLGYNVFLLFAYVTTFGKGDALRAASYWRYSMHLGMIVMAFSLFGISKLWHERWSGKFDILRFKWLVVAVLLLAPFVFAKKLRFDRTPMTVHYRQVGAEISAMLGPDDAVFIADPRGSGESAAILGFEMRSGAKMQGYVGAFHARRVKPVKDASTNTGITSIIVYTQLPEYRDIFSFDLQPKTSYFLKRDANRNWKIVKTWQHPRS